MDEREDLLDEFMRDLRRIGIPESVHMHVDTARRLGLEDGETVKHENGQTTRIHTYGTPSKEPSE